MNTSQLRELFPSLGEQIGKGVDGSVYLLGENQVIKLSSSYDQTLLAELADGYYHHYVRVDDFGVLTSPYDDCSLRGDEDQTHFTVMERLLPLTTDEKKVFHSILSHEDRGLSKFLTPEQLHTALDGLEAGLEFDRKQVVKFYAQVVLSSLTHLDLHERNILKDKNGAFKLIDLNRIAKIRKETE